MDVLLNLLLFAPLGLGLGLLRVSRPRAGVLIFLATGTIELLQATVIVGRDASLSDLLTNSTGGLAGYWLAGHWPALVLPGVMASRRLAWASLGSWLVLWVLTATLLGLSPPALPWWSQVAPRGVTPADYPGRVQRVTVNGQAVFEGRMTAPNAILDGLAADTAVIDVVTIAGGTTEDLASIFIVYNQGEEEAILLGQNGSDLVFRERRRAADARLRGPVIALTGAMGRPGDTLALRAVIRGPSLFLRAVDGSDTVQDSLRLTASVGWVLLLPGFFGLGSMARIGSSAWLLGTLFPAGYWARRAGLWNGPGGRTWWLAAGCAVLMGLWGTALFWNAAPASPLEALAAAAGLAVGAAVAWPAPGVP
ncbi:MAG: VanZ family protein [Gemmatimonadales bacterium]